MEYKRIIAGLGVFLTLNLLIVIFLHDTVPAVAGLYPELPAPVHWFVASRIGLLYFLTPLVITAAIVTLLAPGLLIVIAGRWADTPGELVLKGFGISLVLHFLTTSVVKVLTHSPLDPARFMLLLSATLVVTFGLLVLRALKTAGMFSMFSDPGNRGRIYLLFAIPFLFIIPLLPAIFWQDLNADGFEAMEIGMTLSTSILPVFPTSAGTLGLGIGMLPMAYPIHWCIMLFGPIEAATRLPMVMYTVVVIAGLQAFIEHEAPRRMRPFEQAVLLLGVACYVTAISFNSGYDNYFTDMSSPPAYETLTILLIIGSGYFFWTGMRSWFLLFAVLGFLARPTMLLVVVLLGAGIWIAAPERRRPGLWLVAAATGIWVALLMGYEHLYLHTVSGAGNPGYSGGSILNRFRFLTFTDMRRFLYAAAPTGILPALSLLAYRWQDPLARFVTIVSAGYFMVFYIPAFTSLHHFIPVMILPLIVLWRLILFRMDDYRPALAVAVSTAVLLYLSLPQHFRINRTFRDIGARTTYLIGNYRGNFADHRKAIQGADLVSAFFRNDWDVADPARELVGGPQQVYYARTSGQPAADTNYLVLPPADSAPADFTLLKRTATGSAWVRDKARWDAVRQHPPSTGYRSRLYQISREDSFNFKGVPAHNYDVNLGSFPLIWRIFPGF
jgi:hypothetical protein